MDRQLDRQTDRDIQTQTSRQLDREAFRRKEGREREEMREREKRGKVPHVAPETRVQVFRLQLLSFLGRNSLFIYFLSYSFFLCFCSSGYCLFFRICKCFLQFFFPLPLFLKGRVHISFIFFSYFFCLSFIQRFFLLPPFLQIMSLSVFLFLIFFLPFL